MRYLTRVPRTVPAGKRLVHNFVRPAHPIGTNGFRCWLQDADADPPTEVCACRWDAAAHLTHYRVVRQQQGK